MTTVTPDRAVLDNPIWHSLTGAHAHLAQLHGRALTDADDNAPNRVDRSEPPASLECRCRVSADDARCRRSHIDPCERLSDGQRIEMSRGERGGIQINRHPPRTAADNCDF